MAKSRLSLTPALLLLVAAAAVTAAPAQPRDQRHPQRPQPESRHPLLIVIFDGFRHDYLELYNATGLRLPNFEAFQQAGVRATQVRNVYPTETLPNHQSLVTGLYAESHGYILNEFNDPQVPFGKFSIYNQDTLNDPEWSDGWPEPLWVTNQRQGGRSGVVLFPNSDVPFRGELPFVQVDQYATLNNGTATRYPYARRVDRILQWLGSPQLYNLSLALLYFDEPDHTGHMYGHLSYQVAHRLLELDAQLGRLIDGLRTRGLLDQVNIVLTADHGMATGTLNTLIDLDSIVSPAWYDNVLSDRDDVHLYIVPKPGRAADILAAVAGQPHLHASLGAELPAWMHFKGSRRTPVMYLYADMPYLIVVGGLPPNPPPVYGVHGYVNNHTEMWPLWLARGPAFRSGGAQVSEQLESVDLYPLACLLLGLEPNPNNGSLARISPVLSPELAAEAKAATAKAEAAAEPKAEAAAEPKAEAAAEPKAEAAAEAAGHLLSSSHDLL